MEPAIGNLAVGPQGGPGEAALWSLVLIVVVLALGSLVVMLRWWYAKWAGQPPEETFSVESLEQMRNSGQISRAEFTRLRRESLGLGPLGEEKAEQQSRTGEKLDDGEKDEPDA